jgi:hypothetical protein
MDEHELERDTVEEEITRQYRLFNAVREQLTVRLLLLPRKKI